MILDQDEQTLIDVCAVMKALADPNRLQIFSLLMKGDSCNCELKDKLGIPPNLLSHHLSILRKVGLVSSRRDKIDGRWIYYAVDRTSIKRWHTWFSTFLDPSRIKARPILCGPEGQVINEPTLIQIGGD